MAYRISVPRAGIEPRPCQETLQVLTTRLPGNSEGPFLTKPVCAHTHTHTCVCVHTHRCTTPAYIQQASGVEFDPVMLRDHRHMWTYLQELGVP